DARHVVRDSTGAMLAQVDDNWDFNPARAAFISKVRHPKTILAMIFTAAPAASATRAAGGGMEPEVEATGQTRGAATAPATTQMASLNLDFYQRQREMSLRGWNELLAAGTNVEVPEPIVNNAWRALIIAQYTMVW